MMAVLCHPAISPKRRIDILSLHIPWDCWERMSTRYPEFEADRECSGLILPNLLPSGSMLGLSKNA